MKRDVLVGTTAARFDWEGNQVSGHLTYGRVSQPDSAQGKEAQDLGISCEYAIAELAPGTYSVVLNGRSFRVVVGANSSKGSAARQLVVNGRNLTVEVFDPRDLRSSNCSAAREGRHNIAAPMPGKVVRVLAAVGDTVEQGQGLVVVEAMKMQNEMKSPKAGRVVEVRAQTDAIVAAGDILVAVE